MCISCLSLERLASQSHTHFFLSPSKARRERLFWLLFLPMFNVISKANPYYVHLHLLRPCSRAQPMLFSKLTQTLTHSLTHLTPPSPSHPPIRIQYNPTHAQIQTTHTPRLITHSHTHTHLILKEYIIWNKNLPTEGRKEGSKQARVLTPTDQPSESKDDKGELELEVSEQSE